MSSATTEATVTWSAENERGRRDAETFMETMRREGKPYLLGFRVREIVDSGKYGGYEVGFFHRLAVELTTK